MKFRCSVLIAPVKNESCDIILYILEFTENNERNRQRRIPKIREYSITHTRSFPKRSWLHMFNPLTRHKSSLSNDVITGGTSDLGGSMATDTTGYM
ncbi:unnamed protein product, partial [Rotaria magnacalcarata]